MLIAIVNESSLISNADAQTMAMACQLQLANDLLPAWGMRSDSCQVQFFPNKTSVSANAWLFNLLDDPTQAGALGYHTEEGDRITAYIFAKPVLDNHGVILYDHTNPNNVSVSSVLSHEVLEAAIDPYANTYLIGPTIKVDGVEYNMYAEESADPVENDSYAIQVNGSPVSVSNFITQAWTNPEATMTDAPFDHLRKLTAPFSMTSGGYMIVAHDGNSTQVFGEHMPSWKVEQKKSEFARFALRK